jgi:hypothetical protein
MIPKPQHFEALSLQVPAANKVFLLLFRMLPTIQFDNEHSLQTSKVGYVRTYRMLAAEFEPGQVPVTQVPPKPDFGIGLVMAQVSGASCLCHKATLVIPPSP